MSGPSEGGEDDDNKGGKIIKKGDGGAHLAELESLAHGATLRLKKGDIAAVEEANKQIDGFLEMLEDSPHNGVAEKVFAQPEVLLRIANLISVYQRILDQLGRMMRSLKKASLEPDPETGLPALVPANTAIIRDMLATAGAELTHLDLGGFPAVGSADITGPDPALLERFSAITTEAALADPTRMLEVYVAVENYVRAGIDVTGIGLASAAESTANQTKAHQTAAEQLHAVARKIDTFKLGKNPDAEELFHVLLLEMVVTAAGFGVVAEEIFGPNAKWLAGHTSDQAVRRLLGTVRASEKQAQEEIAKKRESDDGASAKSGLFRTFLASLTIAPDGKLSPPTYAALGVKVRQARDTAAKIQALLKFNSEAEAS
jgi:hypothetical protein